ncbi:MAG: hypothetical protein RLZZ66_193 [Pseudomonadota bacterium]|jgi:integrase
MSKHLLTDTKIKNSSASDKPIRLSDGDGVFLIVNPNGGKWWRLAFSFQGKRDSISLGTYPIIGLKDARKKAEEIKKQISRGINPHDSKRNEKEKRNLNIENSIRIAQGLPIANSFSDITHKYLLSIKHLINETTLIKKTSRFERLAFPGIGNIPIADVKSSDIFEILKPLIKSMQLETCRRLCREISNVFSYAIVHDYCSYDPAHPVAKQIPPNKPKHRAAIINPIKFGQLLRDIQNYNGTFVVQCAFLFSPHVFQRPGEISSLKWADINFNDREWRPYISKTDFHHIVPLSTQAISILQQIRPLTGGGEYVFPSSRGDGRPMSSNTIRTALRSLGYDANTMTAHGFRTTASTLLNEQGWSPDAIERQLAHSPNDSTRDAYNRAEYIDERRIMMQAWSDYLDVLKNSV